MELLGKSYRNVPTLRFNKYYDNWTKKSFEEVFETVSNNTLSRAELNYENGNYKNIHYGDVLIKFPTCVSALNDIVPYISIENEIRNLDNNRLKNGDIIIADTAEDYTVGKAIEIENADKIKTVAGLHTIPCRPKLQFAPKFLGYYINSRSFHNQLIPFIQGIKVSSISKSLIKKTTLSYPSIDEQKDIAFILSKVEARIEVQNKIIKDRKSLIKRLIFHSIKNILKIIFAFATGNVFSALNNLLQLLWTIYKEVKQMVNQKNISQISDLWKEEKRHFVKKSTYAAYSLIVDIHILPKFGNLTNVQEKDAQDFVLHKLENGLSQKTIKDMLIVLRMILKFGAKNNYCVYIPFDIVFPTEREKQDLEVLSVANQKKIMKFVEENFTFKNLGIFICLSTGIRIGEICALTWDDIDIENGVLHIRKTLQRIYFRDNGIKKSELIIDTPKTATSMRNIPMTKDLFSVLKPLKKVVTEEFYVVTNEKFPTEPRTYRNFYKKLLSQLDIPPIKFHGMRHSFATRCIESHCDYKTVSVILGHSNISTTLNLYVHPNYEQKKKCIDKMMKTLK